MPGPGTGPRLGGWETLVYSIAYSESFGQDNAHSDETTVSPYLQLSLYDLRLPLWHEADQYPGKRPIMLCSHVVCIVVNEEKTHTASRQLKLRIYSSHTV